ncbi:MULTISPECIES: hypothetical protein [Polymorphospora]|uniref:Uncharacterized protein n=1 Tax=Polymorphospora lycopeni TaxID=3140240 RepID=A0ABV5CQ59_9ACTN
MRLFRRRPKLPADRRPALDPEERVLDWSPAGSGDDVVVLTNRGLWLPGRSGRLPWHEIHKAVWSGRELTVTPAEVLRVHDEYAVVADRPAESYLLLDPGDVPHQVRTRVTGSVAHTVHHPLPGGGVRIVARRVGGVDGLSWAVRYDPGTAYDDEEIRAATVELVERFQRESTPSDL